MLWEYFSPVIYTDSFTSFHFYVAFTFCIYNYE